MRIAFSVTALSIVLLGFVLSSVGGCQARYRYPCQDPVNWDKLECHNDICKVEGDCTSHTLGELYKREDSDPNAATETDTTKELVPEIEEKTNPEPEHHISNKVEHTVPTESVGNEPSEHLSCTPAVTCTSDESPLTMDTVVNTKEHNLAAR